MRAIAGSAVVRRLADYAGPAPVGECWCGHDHRRGGVLSLRDNFAMSYETRKTVTALIRLSRETMGKV